jgi:hypothetical protein
MTTSPGAEQLLPRGNPLIENMTLPVADIEQMLENLLADEFVGVVQMKLATATGFFVLRSGRILRALEGTNRGVLIARLPARIYALLRQRSTAEVSTFVMSEAMVSVLSTAFAFTAFMPDKRIERKELKSVLSSLDSNKLTGFMRVVGPQNLPTYLLVDEGEILTERFAEGYGDIVCGPIQVSAVLDHVYENGSRISIRAEKTDAIDRKSEEVDLDLSRIRQLTLKKASALFRSSEEVKLSEDVFREWGVDTKATFEVELETADGRMFTYKCKSGSSRLGQRVEVHSNMLKDMNVGEGDLVNVRPILS